MFDEKIDINELLEYGMNSSVMSSKMYFNSVEEAINTIYELINKGEEGRAFIYRYIGNETYRKTNLTVKNKSEWNRFLNGSLHDTALIADARYGDLKVCIEFFFGFISNDTRDGKVLGYIRCVDEKNCVNKTKREFYTKKIPNSIKEIIEENNGDFLENKENTIRFDDTDD